MRLFLVLLAFISLIYSCSTVKKIPEKKYNQFTFYSTYSVEKDSIKFALRNPLMCPLRITISSENKHLREEFSTRLLKEKQDTTFKIACNEKDIKLSFYGQLGDVNRKISNVNLSLPIKQNKQYKIIQGYNGNFSHNNDFSKYSVDFSLSVNDTVYSVDKGFVVGVIKDYKNNGGGKNLRENANFITIYHPHSGLFSQYVHLINNGSLVKIGEEVSKSQPIGLSGKTGYTNIEHLHFNALIPSEQGSLKSIPVNFEGNIKGSDLRKGTIVNRKGSPH